MNNNPLVNAREQIKGACEVLGYKEEVYESLKDPQRFIEISIPVRMDNGEVKYFKGFPHGVLSIMMQSVLQKVD